MINPQQVKEIVEKWLEGRDYFITDINVTPDARIVVEIDQQEGVWIEDCVELSRFIESQLDRDIEDYELEVGSAGLGQPFKVHQQYVIHTGDDVEVITNDGRKTVGALTAVDDEGIVLTTVEKVKHEGEKRPRTEEVQRNFTFADIKTTKLHINFK